MKWTAMCMKEKTEEEGERKQLWKVDRERKEEKKEEEEIINPTSF